MILMRRLKSLLRRKPQAPRTDFDKPKVINFQANDICNLACRMCHIWQQKLTTQVSPNDLRSILMDPFFSEVEHVGITGGEPTLRNDLFDLYMTCLDTLPAIRGVSFITNGSMTKKALETYTKVAEVCKSRGKSFSGMVSIDGVGSVHDKVRGKERVFERAWETLTQLRQAGIEVHPCCTIIKSNVYEVQDLLDFCKRNDIYIRFRVGEYIDRLYNTDITEEIRSFSPREIAHLSAFFLSLIAFYETDERVHRTYKSILSLLNGGNRKIQCPYQRGLAVNLTSKGEFSYCAPKGKLHQATEQGYEPAFKANLPERKSILENSCSKCIHDYHDEYTPAASAELSEAPWHRIQKEINSKTISSKSFAPKISSWSKITICGWYGTETAGDIAILKGIIRNVRENNPTIQIDLLSLFPEYTQSILGMWNAKEKSQIKVLSYWDSRLLESIKVSDAVIMGGGPLMDLPQTKMISELFQYFALNRKETIVWGCGIGPLNNEEYRNNVTKILQHSSQIWLRDHSSQLFCQNLAPQKPSEVINDPSVEYIKSLNIHHKLVPNAPIRMFLRELTAEYPQKTSADDAFQQLVGLVHDVLARYPNDRIELCAMHFFEIGGDDRIFGKRLVDAIKSDRLTVVFEPRSPEEVLQAMATSKFCVSMRFHSVVFANTVGAPFVAIDYTNGGKISAFLKEREKERLLIPLAEVKREGLPTIERNLMVQI